MDCKYFLCSSVFILFIFSDYFQYFLILLFSSWEYNVSRCMCTCLCVSDYEWVCVCVWFEPECMFSQMWFFDVLDLGFCVFTSFWNFLIIISSDISSVSFSLSSYSWIPITRMLDHLIFSAVLQCSVLFIVSWLFQWLCYSLYHWKLIVVPSNNSLFSFHFPQPQWFTFPLGRPWDFRPFWSGWRLACVS